MEHLLIDDGSRKCGKNKSGGVFIMLIILSQQKWENYGEMSMRKSVFVSIKK